MQLKTILNRIRKFKRFVFGDVYWAEDASEPQINVNVQARANSWAQCSVCRSDCAGYDTLTARRYEFIPFWGIRVFLAYTSRRVSCVKCGVRVEYVPWTVGKHRLTTAYGWYLSRWAKRMSWKAMSEAFHTSWHHLFCSVEMAARVIALQAQNDVLYRQEQVLQQKSQTLQTQNHQYQKTLKREQAKISALDRHIHILEQQLAAFRRARYGRSSEKLDEHIYQLKLMLEDLGASVSEERSTDPISKKGSASVDEEQTTRLPANRQSLPPQLPHEHQRYELGDICECCGSALVEFDEDTSELLEYVPASFRVINRVRPKYRYGCSDKVHQAPVPGRPIPRSYAGPGLLAYVAVAKFLDHLPLYRQSHIYSREGVELSRSTLLTGSGCPVRCCIR